MSKAREQVCIPICLFGVLSLFTGIIFIHSKEMVEEKDIYLQYINKTVDCFYNTKRYKFKKSYDCFRNYNGSWKS